jgi:ABC-type branched-subunit amino acid transport system permease subunit
MTDSEAASASEPATVEEAADDPPAPDEESYGGVLGAFPYAFRQSDSRLFKLYAAVGGVLGAVLTVFFGLALVVQIFNTLSGTGGLFTFSRALFVMVGLFVVGPIIAPALLVARRHRRTGSTVRYDRLVGAAGVVFLLSLYLAVLASAPPDLRSPASGPLAPLIGALYAMPAPAAILFPVAGGAGIYAAHRLAR